MSRARSLAVLAAAAAVPTLSHATLASSGSPAYETPSFACSGSSLSSIDWGDITDGTITNSTITLKVSAGSLVPAVQDIACSGPTDLTNFSGDRFSLEFGELNNSINWGDATQKIDGIKIQSNSTVDQKIGMVDQKVDIYLPATDAAGKIDMLFLGLDAQYKPQTPDSSILPFNFTLDSQGTLTLDPPIYSDMSISFYDTPAVPEPTSLLLLGTGLAAAASLRKRK